MLPLARSVRVVLCCAVASSLVWVSSSWAVGITRVVVLTGEAAPDANGSFFSFSTPALNDAGQAAFYGHLTGTSSGGLSDNRGIFRGDGATLTQIVRTGDAAPDANGNFFGLTVDRPAFNDAGQAAFWGGLTGTSGGGSDGTGIFLGDGATPVQIARRSDAAPDANGSFSRFDRPAFNDAGQAAFRADLIGTSGGTSDNEGFFRGDGATLTQIVRKGDAAPDANGSFFDFDFFFSSSAFNDAGQAALRADLVGTSGGTSDNEGIFRGDGTTLTQIARAGDAAPDANGSFYEFFTPALNDAGQVAFRGFLTGTSGGTSDAQGIFRGDGATLTQIARQGDAAPDANGSFLNLTAFPVLNNAGQAAFWSSLTGTSGGDSDDNGIFRSDGTTLVQIVREGDAAPDANGSFVSLDSFPALNDAGQVAFAGSLTPPYNDRGIFLYDDGLGLIQVAREGDALLGSTISGVNLSNGQFGEEQSGLNALGQVAYRFYLTDGRSGVAIWTIPEPTALALIGVGGPLLLARRRRA